MFATCDRMIFQWLMLLKLKIFKNSIYIDFFFYSAEIRTSVLRHIRPRCWLDHRWYGSQGGNMGWYTPLHCPLSHGYAPPTPLDPFSGRLGLRVSSVKLKTLNAFYGHFRSFAHPKPCIKNDQRKKIYNPVLIVFLYQKTCLGREEPTSSVWCL